MLLGKRINSPFHSAQLRLIPLHVSSQFVGPAFIRLDVPRLILLTPPVLCPMVRSGRSSFLLWKIAFFVMFIL